MARSLPLKFFVCMLAALAATFVVVHNTPVVAASATSSLSGTGQAAYLTDPPDPNTGAPNQGNWNAIYAQGFSLGTNDSSSFGVSGVTAGSTVSLNQFEFFRSGRTTVNDDGTGGTLPTPTNVLLAIVNSYFANYSTFPTTTGNGSPLVALSTNTIASIPISGSSYGEPLIFNFASVPLTFGPASAFNTAYDYVAIFVSNNGGVLTPVRVPTIIVNYAETPPGSGTFLPLHDYGDPNSDYYNATSNYFSGGYFSPFQPIHADSDFVASFTFSPLKGDFNGDGHFDASDISGMEQALVNPSAFESANGLSASDLVALGDFNGDGVVNNADLQGMLTALQNGQGSLSSVPEPSALALGVMTAVAMLYWRARRVD